MSRLVLDAGAVLALARGDVRTRAFVERAIRERQDVILPTPVLAQVHRGGRERARIDRVLKAVDVFLPTSAEVARSAGELLGHADMADAVDGIVAAEALAGAPATVVTSDPKDLSALVHGGADPDRVLIFGV
jgi:predicted nucleic acid-binding protein